MNQNLSVHLRVYRGKELLLKPDGSYKNENYTVKLAYETAEYKKFLELLRTNGYVKVDVERVLDLKKVEPGEKYGYAELSGKALEQIVEEVNKAFAIPAPNQTPEQKEIAELRQKLDTLLEAGTQQKASKASKGEETADTNNMLTGSEEPDATQKPGTKK